MNSRGVAIKYGDIAPEAKENFVPTASESEFDTLWQLSENDLDFPNYGNPCELYSVILDGGALPLPSDVEAENIGLWSKQVSALDGIFEEPITLTLISDNQYSSQGLTLTFDTYNQIHPLHLTIKWFRDTEGERVELSPEGGVDFYPDSAFYFCKYPVENYNRIEIAFYRLNMPNNRLKLRAIDYGYNVVFEGDELMSVNLIQEISPISTDISINTADFVVASKSGIDYSFQERQPLEIYFNGKLQATSFVEKATRKSKNIWNVRSEDYIGVLDEAPYYGGMYNNCLAVDVLEDIFRVGKVPFEIDAEFSQSNITGYIPICSCREALMQVAFAIQAVVDTSNSKTVKVFSLSDEVKQHIPLERIMLGQSFSKGTTVSAVEITLHNYKPTEEVVGLFDAEESGSGENIFVKFSEPMHSLSITHGQIVSSGANFAVIDATEGCVLEGKKYEHTSQVFAKKNPLVLANEKEKIIAITTATLVSKHNIDNVLNKCYNWITKTNEIDLSVVEGKHIIYGNPYKYGSVKYGQIKYGQVEPNIIIYDEPVSCGDVNTCETEYLGTIRHRVTKQSFSLNGGIIIKKCHGVILE